MPFFNRLALKALNQFIEDPAPHKNVLILAGARQVGKTSLLQEALKNRPHLFINFEKTPSVAAAVDQCQDFKDFEGYLLDEFQFRPDQKILVFDEAQVSKKLGRFVRFMKEEWKQATVIITGSLISELHEQEEELRRPVGRETFLELWPLNFKEFLMAMQYESLVETLQEFQIGQTISTAKHERFLEAFHEYLEVGGLPEVISYYRGHKDYRKRRADIFKAYEDDFARYFSLEEIGLFQRSMDAVASNLGSPSKDTHVVRLDSPGYKKVAAILSRLEKWKLIIKCEQRGKEPEKNKFSPKRYLYDVGVAGDRRLKGMENIHLRDLDSLTTRSALGGLIENALALSLKIQFGEDFFGFKLSSQSEIDFVVKHQNGIFPVECKLSLKFKKNYLKGLKQFLKDFPKAKSFLFYGGEPIAKAQDSTIILPFYMADELKRLVSNL